MNWRDYEKPLTVSERRARAKRDAARLKKKRAATEDSEGPVEINGQKIASRFWGIAWCENLERYHDYHSRLARGRSYVRSGCVVSLSLSTGRIKALVSGSSVYTVNIDIKALGKRKWQQFKRISMQEISSVIDLLRGKLPENMLKHAIDKDNGLFPSPSEISFYCSCPDRARMCKHVAAVLYGIGHRLDQYPELFFTLRGCDVQELQSTEELSDALVDISVQHQNGRTRAGIRNKSCNRRNKASSSKRKSDAVAGAAPIISKASNQQLGKLFGIDLES